MRTRPISSIEPLLVAILAGGEGRRIGGGKPLRLLGGESLLSRAIGKARSWSSDVRIVVRSRGMDLGADLPVICDERSIEGPLGGIAAALRAAGPTGVITLPIDMPFLPADLAAGLIDSVGDRHVALARSEGRVHPVCGYWRPAALQALPTYLASGRRSLRGFAEAAGFIAVDWPVGPFFNINDEADLAEAERRLTR